MGWSSCFKHLVLFPVVVTITFLPRNNNAALIRETHVYIYNLLEFGPTLTVHCWSKDDDLGDHDVPPNDLWDFSFGLDIFGRTQFDCTFHWNDETHRFPIYVQMRDNWACQNCNWTVTSAGPCRKVGNGTSTNDVCYHWHDNTKESSTQYLLNF